jgi:tetratricopeptide (TPR) repeat protein
VRILGRGSRIAGRWSLFAVLALATGTVGDPVHRSRCDLAFDAHAWQSVVDECRAPRWRDRARLARAWIAWDEHHPDQALATAEQLLDTDVDPDAAYLSAYIHAVREGDTSGEDFIRDRFQRALTGFQRAGRHASASLAAGFLSRVPRPEAHFDDQLRMSQVAVEEAQLSGDDHILARALDTLAEAYDWIGMEAAARDSFQSAEQLSEPWPDELAQIYFKHAAFLLDLGTRHSLDAALAYLDVAATKRDAAIAGGLGTNVATLALAIRLDRADALSQLNRLAAADRELAQIEHDLGPSPDDDKLGSLRLVQGYVAARRHDTSAAEALFRQADDGALDGDFRIRIALELARAYLDTGDRDRAEHAYRAAIEIVEQLRRTASEVELRPWMLARRTSPYVELLALLVEQDRGVDALVIAESLHARAWLDVVLGDRTAPAHALAAERIWPRLHALPAPPLDAKALMATIGDREALVFLAIGAQTWRGHVMYGRVSFERLPDDTVDLASRFRAHPGNQAAGERAAAVLLPADLAVSSSPLHIIATGALADVPYAALRTRGRYLIEDRPVARLPGLVARQCATSAWAPRVVVIGDSRGDLPEAAREVQRIADSTGAPPLVGAAASRAALAPAHGARLLHIAAHGIALRSGPAIALADGDLTAADVLELDLNPEVVVLTGCSTAASDDAESWDGFPSAFLAAGSRYVVATLRSVNDAPAARVTSAYYAQPESLNPIERLAAAQRALIDVLPVEAWASFAAWGSDACDAPGPPDRAK